MKPIKKTFEAVFDVSDFCGRSINDFLKNVNKRMGEIQAAINESYNKPSIQSVELKYTDWGLRLAIQGTYELAGKELEKAMKDIARKKEAMKEGKLRAEKYRLAKLEKEATKLGFTLIKERQQQ